MIVIRNLKEWSHPGTKVCLAIGFFDGVHLGHQQVIRQTIAEARQQSGAAVVVTFDRHPNSVVAPDRVPLLIYPLERKLEALRALGVDVSLLLEFNISFSQQTGEAFVRSLATEFAPLRSVCVGSDFVFGHKRSGNVELLRRLGDELGFNVRGHAAELLEDQIVSSTRIRDCIRTGELDAASRMLGRPYSLNGKVVTGDKRGREMGFPTANLEVTGLVLPLDGVYAVRTICKGQTHHAVLNIGYRPTLQNLEPQLRVEAHLLEFNGNLYGAEMEVIFVGKLREETRFATLGDLREQIGRDITEARRMF